MDKITEGEQIIDGIKYTYDQWGYYSEEVDKNNNVIRKRFDYETNNYVEIVTTHADGSVDGHKWYSDGNEYIKKVDSTGNYTEVIYDENGDVVSYTIGDSIGNYTKRDKDERIIASNTVYSENHSKYQSFHENGKLYNHCERNGDNFENAWYDENGNLFEKNVVNPTEESTTYYAYDENNNITNSTKTDRYDNSRTETKYIDSIAYSDKAVNNRVVQSIIAKDDLILRESNYEYYDNGKIKRLLIQEYDHDFYREKEYTYDENGNSSYSDDYYMNDKFLAHLTDPGTSIKETDNGFVFTRKDGTEFLFIDKDGNRVYKDGDEYQKFSNEIHLNSDGTYYSITNLDGNITKVSGKYTILDNGHILCDSDNNEKCEYNSLGQLIKKEVDGVVYSYDISNLKETVTKNGKSTYALINHIEYDQEEYDYIMRNLVSICDDYPSKINNDCNSCEDIITSFPDKYSTSSINSINNNIQSEINTINELKESINYSLLAYSTCDKNLEEKIHSLIDSLFDESETTLARVFKHDIRSHIEDLDNDKIMEYKKDTNFLELYQTLIPVSKSVDSDGNIWYSNLRGNIVGVIGDNPKITYGNEVFSVKVGNDGILKLVDSNGSPIQIFGEYNVGNGQYGGNQRTFLKSEVLLHDENILRVLDKYYDLTSTEEVVDFFNRVSETACGYTALTNIVFREFEGKEEEFYKTFGYPMYNFSNSPDGAKVDFNYEPMILDLYSYINSKDGAVATSKFYADGVYEEIYYKMYNYLHDEYGIFDKEYNDYIADCGIFGDYGYNLYDIDGNLIYADGYSHAMVKTGEIDSTRWYVSSYGEKMICETHKPTNEVINPVD